MKRFFSITTIICLMELLSGKSMAQLGQYTLSFDGIDDYVSIPHTNAYNVSAVTMEMWIYWESNVADAVQFIIAKDFEQLEIHTGGNAGANALRFIPTDGVWLDTPVDAFSANGWYHIAFVYDPSGTGLAKCYINGVEATLTSTGANSITTPITASTMPLLLGKRSSEAATVFKGKMDEVRIWNTVRTQEQIENNMYKELSGSESGLIAYYRMEEGSGTTITDASANSNSGTLNNGVSWYYKGYSVADLQVTGTNIKWYNSSTGGSAITDITATPLVNGTTYYASQTIDGVESTNRLAVAAILNPIPIPPSPGTNIPSQTQIVWNWSAVSGATGYKWSTNNNYNLATDLGNILTVTQTGLICNSVYTIYVWAYNSTCVSNVSTFTQNTTSCGNLIVSNIDFANGGANLGILDANDKVIITFSKEINPTTIFPSLSKGGSVSLTNSVNQIDFYTNSNWSLAGYYTTNGWHIGTFTEHGTVDNGAGGTPHFNLISLDASGTVLTLSLINASGTAFASASSSNYVGFTPDGNIKAADGTSITSSETRQANGSTVF